MTETKKNPNVRVRTGVKAGGWELNHGTRVRSPNVRVRTGVKAGGWELNHGTRVRSPKVACAPV
jgi:hypothetical protein